jgi:hypothetical protein
MSEPAADTAPAESTKAFLRTVWCDVLDVPAVRDDDSFLALGGDSISAVLCSNRIRSVLAVEVPVVLLLSEDATFETLATHLKTATNRA